jgi:sugar phosphate isomerase/epimerase
MKLGLNLYSIRNLIQTEEDFLQTATLLKDMGYAFVQFSGAPIQADALKRVSERVDLPIVLTHSTFDKIVNDTEKLMEEHAKFSCKNIGIGYMETVKISDDDFKRNVEILNATGEKMLKNGFKLFYHNHHYELKKRFGVPMLFYMLENAPFLNFTLDTYWLQYGGVETLNVVEKFKDRIECVHLKDYKLNEENTPCFAPLGEGTMDFQKIVKKM